MKTLFCFFAGLLACATIFSCGHAKTNLNATDTGKTVVRDSGVMIAYKDTGISDTSLLFVHGWAINKDYWANQRNYFGKRYHVVTIDLPGYGQSGKNRHNWSTLAFAHDVDSVIKQLKLKKVVLIGHSMAGDIVLQVAVDNPATVVGIVGVDNFKGVGVPQTQKDKKDWAAALTLMKQHFKKVAFTYFNQQLFSKSTPPDVRKRVLGDVAKTDSAIAIASMEQQHFDELAQLKAAKKKLYLINSDIQPTDTTYLIANKIPYKVYYVPGSGHFPMVEHPQVFNMHLDKVLAELGSRRR